jgi:hypothetical protein
MILPAPVVSINVITRTDSGAEALRLKSLSSLQEITVHLPSEKVERYITYIFNRDRLV